MNVRSKNKSRMMVLNVARLFIYHRFIFACNISYQKILISESNLVVISYIYISRKKLWKAKQNNNTHVKWIHKFLYICKVVKIGTQNFRTSSKALKMFSWLTTNWTWDQTFGNLGLVKLFSDHSGQEWNSFLWIWMVCLVTCFRFSGFLYCQVPPKVSKILRK